MIIADRQTPQGAEPQIVRTADRQTTLSTPSQDTRNAYTYTGVNGNRENSAYVGQSEQSSSTCTVISSPANNSVHHQQNKQSAFIYEDPRSAGQPIPVRCNGSTRTAPRAKSTGDNVRATHSDRGAAAFNVNHPPSTTSRFVADEEEDYSVYVRRKVKRFYVGGFKSNMTIDKFINYVERRGVTVTWVKFFEIRNSNRITIRLNIDADEKNCDSVLSDWFWPKNVTCRPWMSWNSYRNQASHRRHGNHDQTHTVSEDVD
jgi:hypothetical protein